MKEKNQIRNIYFRYCVPYSSLTEITSNYCTKFMKKDTVVVSQQGIKKIRTFGILFFKSIELFYKYGTSNIHSFKGFMTERLGKHFDYFFFFLFFGGRWGGGREEEDNVAAKLC